MDNITLHYFANFLFCDNKYNTMPLTNYYTWHFKGRVYDEDGLYCFRSICCNDLGFKLFSPLLLPSSLPSNWKVTVIHPGSVQTQQQRETELTYGSGTSVNSWMSLLNARCVILPGFGVDLVFQKSDILSLKCRLYGKHPLLAPHPQTVPLHAKNMHWLNWNWSWTTVNEKKLSVSGKKI